MTADGRPAGVLFDLDGTLVDTCYLHAIAWTRAFRDNGFEVETAVVHRAVGRGSEELIAKVLGEHDPARDEAVSARHRELFAATRDQAVAFRGARDLLRQVSSNGQRVVVATSAGPQDVEPLLGLLRAQQWIDEVANGSETDRSKPAPDILEVALDRSGLRAGESVFVGDAVWDVEAAGRVGMPCVGLECGGTSAAELLEAGAVQTFAHPQALLEAYDASALAAVSTGPGR